MKPQLSVIITWFNRPELRRSLGENCLIFDRYDVEVIVVNCGGSKTELHKILSGPGPRSLRCLNIPATVFNKSLAINVGASTAQSERLFLLDADIVLTDDFLPVAFDTVAQQCFFTVDRVLESDREPWPLDDHLEEMAHQISFLAKDGRKATTTIRRRLHEGSRSGPGLIVLARQHFLEVGGMNADLHGYGWEDRDLLLRLQFALGLEERSAGKVLHLSHQDESQDAAWRDRETGERLNSAACVKNYRAGHFAGTYYDDLRIWKERISLNDLAL